MRRIIFFMIVIFVALSAKYAAATWQAPQVQTLTVGEFSPGEEKSFESRFPFTALVIRWKEKPETLWSAQFLQNGTWTPVSTFGADRDADDDMEEPDFSEAFIPINPSAAFRIRADFRATDVIFTMLYGGRSPAKTRKVSAASGLGIISRAEWGADESFREYKPDRPMPKIIPIDGEYLEKFADELQIKKKIEYSETGHLLTWPLQYPEKVSKIIIHHTATTKNLDDPAQAMRDIFYWHTFGRGWGDIGYNYIIAPDGSIYEGRAGGEGVTGAHAGKSNTGSIGIAILGNYETGEVSDPAFQSLMMLVREKALIHGIDPQGKSLWRGETIENVIGHRDVMPTACPGKNLYASLETIRKLASQQTSVKQKMIFASQKKKGYDFSLIDAPKIVSLEPEDDTIISLTIENKGSQTWGAGTYFVIVSSDENMKRMLQFSSLNFPRIATLKSSLKTGERFSLTTKIGSLRRGGVTELNIVPVINGTLKLGKFVRVPVYVKQPIYTYEIVAQKTPPKVLQAGKTFFASLTLKNTGNVTWSKEDTLPKSVKPGETVTMNIPVQSFKVGSYIYDPLLRLRHFFPLQGPKIEFSTYIYKDMHAAKPVGFSTHYTVEKGATELFVVSLKNIGGATWTKQSFPILKPVGEKKLSMQNFVMLEEQVKPGETATIQFAVKVPATAGLQTFLAKPYFGTAPMMKMNLHFAIETVEKKKNLEFGPDLRVKLSFKGDPKITSSGRYEIFVGKEKIAVMEKGAVASVQKMQNGIEVSYGAVKKIFEKPIRFQPLGIAILELKNWERRPSWNPSINDNRFRGVLEAAISDGELVMINELPLEQYLKGLAETASDDPEEKVKAIVIVARTYALFYQQAQGADRKFPNKPYDLSDDPEKSQKYLGYVFEKRSLKVSNAVNETKKLTVTYQGKIVKTPYFSQSDGKTRSAYDAWGWTYTPYLIGVPDLDCVGLIVKGHGVGMSGCGARAKALRGETFEQILKYYYKGIEVKPYDALY